MILKNFLSIKKIISATALGLLLACGIAQANPLHLEGKLPSQSHASGYFDLQVQIYVDGKDNAHLMQTIQLAKVLIQNGEFKISLETSLDLAKEKNLTFKVKSREFETGEAFQSGEIAILAKN